MLQRLFILQGQLRVPSGTYPSLAYQLRRKDSGEIETFDFRGEGIWQDGQVNFLRYGMHGPVSEFLVDPQPTKESVDFQAGYEFAQQQKQKRHPGQKRSEAFLSGWRSVWSERRPFQFPDEKRRVKQT